MIARPPVSSGAAGRHLELDAAVAGQGERRGEGQLGDVVAADLLPRLPDELEERGAGQQHGAGDHVLGEPGVRATARRAR